MPRKSRAKPIKGKREAPVREAADVEREAAPREPERGVERDRDVERDEPARGSVGGYLEHQD